MRLLADESVDYPVVNKLRQNGFDITYIAEINSGISDVHILELANTFSRILLTADKDFGELVFRHKKINNGVILYRLSGLTNQQKADIILNICKEHSDKFQSHFVLIDKNNIRIKSLI